MKQSISESLPAGKGDAFQETVATWLSRNVPKRAQNQCFDLPVVLSTDIGLQRQENQDRIAALRLSARQGSHPIISVVVADGMGGMRDGARCATLTVSSFFQALVRHRNQGLEARAAAAAAHANDAVYAFARGQGGATLSAVIFDAGAQPIVINLGDSRIYGGGKGVKVERLTVDDSLEEAVGGHGRELLQFVGMGDGMKPHIRTVPPNVLSLALTTDGIHYIQADMFASVLYNAPDPKSASDRLSALARWCGGHDNASMAMVDLNALLSSTANSQEGGIQVWDPFGTMSISWLRDIAEVPKQKAAAAPEVASLEEKQDLPNKPNMSRKGIRRTSKRGGKLPRFPEDDIQLEIHIENSADTKEGDDDSR